MIVDIGVSAITFFDHCQLSVFLVVFVLVISVILIVSVLIISVVLVILVVFVVLVVFVLLVIHNFTSDTRIVFVVCKKLFV